MVFEVNDDNFAQAALSLFQFQYVHNSIYHQYVDYLGVVPGSVKALNDIPFLPIRFFKEHKVVSDRFVPEMVFESSGTTQHTPAKHYIEDLNYYNKLSHRIFEGFFGHLQDAVVLGLLPSYLERSNSSLVYMVNQFIKTSSRPESGFFLSDFDGLLKQLKALANNEVKVYMFGVTFALLQLAVKCDFRLPNLSIFETGGMKGRGREMIREEVHAVLGKGFKDAAICSEYGMTELMSQAYMDQAGIFRTPPWMKVKIREINDPFALVDAGRTGAINIIDLANAHSVAFLETEDLGVEVSGGFKVLGRMDNSDTRGCNLLVAQ
jgi:phenylacetate-coenzyme A ligase PaaK-like adenylate-forming protein